MASKTIFPLNLVKPIRDFLSGEAKRLEKQKVKIIAEDPFEDVSRVDDNASVDLEADEQFNHARTTALQAQIDRKLIQIRQALSRIKIGKYGLCESCGRMIDTDRLMVIPEATLCVACEQRKEQ
ncbi:MAG: TraR/DksA C4-type zinc finger protein [Candidatus Shapirobacteria bacterium]